MQADWIFGVYDLNEYVRVLLSGDRMLRAVRLRGEISGFKRHYSGHMYFSLKDERARVQCVMFKQNAASLSFLPADGMKVVIEGSVSLFVRDGSYQVYCESIKKEGVGELYARFEQLKQRLSDEGLFDPALKRPLPALPATIGVVTSRTGAVLRDIVRVARRRNPRISIQLSPAAVQGEGAAREIADAIDLINAVGSADVILCGRGGGSIEDLWAFNEEIVARAISRSKIPVISCVGHETDFTIADFVSDLRAPTPSAAAELAVPIVAELARDIDGEADRLYRALTRRQELNRARLERLSGSPALSSPGRTIIDPRLSALEAAATALDVAAARRIDAARRKLELHDLSLHSLNPGAVIERGYAVVRSGGRAVTGAADLAQGQNIDIKMRGGDIGAVVTRAVNEE